MFNNPVHANLFTLSYVHCAICLTYNKQSWEIQNSNAHDTFEWKATYTKRIFWLSQ